jgi:hypothetical protein
MARPLLYSAELTGKTNPSGASWVASMLAISQACWVLMNDAIIFRVNNMSTVYGLRSTVYGLSDRATTASQLQSATCEVHWL